ncbi:MAG: hypothetical protein ACF8PN_04590 [Phycisphaerales bacterium]
MDDSSVQRAAAWDCPGSVQILGTLGGDESTAFGVNELGSIVGFSQYESGNSSNHAFLWRNGVMTDLGDFGGGYSKANAINNQDEVVGRARPVSGSDRAFLWRDGVMIDLGDFGGPGSTAIDINELGWVAGTADIGNGRAHATLWADGQMIDLHQAGTCDQSCIWAMNEIGDMVGTVDDDCGGDERTFVLWIDRVMFELSDFLPPNHRWNFHNPFLAFPQDINDALQIVGAGGRGSDIAAFLMTPVYPAFDLELVGAAQAGAVNTIRATGLTPGDRVHFVWGVHGGGTIIPGCDLQRAALQIENAQRAGAATADASGVATFTAFVPDAARDLGEILIQAVDATNCAVSPYLVVRFE